MTNYTRQRSHLRKKHGEGKTLEGVAFTETVSCILESESEGPFYITDLAELY